MSNRPPDATITANVSTEGTTAECRRAVVALTGGLKWTRDPLARLIPYSFLRGGIVNHMHKRVRLSRLSDSKYRKINIHRFSEAANQHLTSDSAMKKKKKLLKREHDGKWSVAVWGWGGRFRGETSHNFPLVEPEALKISSRWWLVPASPLLTALLTTKSAEKCSSVPVKLHI